jgi:predicted MarR family transcription regulator
MKTLIAAAAAILALSAAPANADDGTLAQRVIDNEVLLADANDAIVALQERVDELEAAVSDKSEGFEAWRSRCMHKAEGMTTRRVKGEWALVDVPDRSAQVFVPMIDNRCIR